MRILIVTIVLIIFSCSADKQIKPPDAVNGILDLREWNFDSKKDSIVSLVGLWEFYWNTFIESPEEQRNFFLDKDAANIHYIPIPSEWQDYKINNASLPSKGYAMYRLRVLMPKTDIPLSFAMTDICMSYRLYVNGVLHHTNGKVGTSEEDSIPFQRHGIFPLQKNAEELEIVFLISNFYHSRAGLWNKISIGSRAQIESNYQNKIALTFFTFGILLIMSIYHFVFYFLRRKDKSPLFFGVMCLALALRTIGMEERVILDLLPFIPFKAIYKLEFITAYVTIAFFFLFIRNLFPEEFSKTILRITLLFSFIACLIPVLFIPYYYDLPLFRSLQFWLIFSILYSGYVLIKAINKNRMGSSAFLIGVSIFFLTIINDVLYGGAIIYTVNLSIYGFLSFVIAQSIVLAIRFTHAFAMEEQYNIVQKEIEISKQRLLEREIQLKEAETVKKKLELGMLKQTIQPHFLMNSLSTLLGLIRENPTRAGKLVNSLGAEVRTMLDVSSETIIPLSTEIEICKSHLDIMAIRLERNFFLKTEGISGEEKFPPLVLQTLIENAFTHSVKYTGNIEFLIKKFSLDSEKNIILDNGKQEISASELQYEFYCIFDDSFVVNTKLPEGNKKGTGTLYIKSRLEESYPNRWSFDQGWENKTWVVKIGIKQ